MPKFVENGPDIPERLLHKHEEGKVIFFCGAGISCNAGLPLFKGLVDQIYAKVCECKPSDSLVANPYEAEQYDIVISLLEKRLGQHGSAQEHSTVRRALFNILKPNYDNDLAKDNHLALIKLAIGRDNKLRLVTTNFDRIFHDLFFELRIDFKHYSAPLLPIPKPTRWDGLVHLHGLLPVKEDDLAGLNNLIISSGDFGLAYLVERWAARFVTELFRYYTICFVGYSINDPIMRYIVDALSVDEQRGEERHEAFAFHSSHYSKPEDWITKGITPISYDGSDDDKHVSLTKTLISWADSYSNFSLGKRAIVDEHAKYPPQAPNMSDYAVGRMLWALTNEAAARHFSELDPVPPLDWMVAFSKNNFGNSDLIRFGVEAGEFQGDVAFSFINRYSPFTIANRMCLVSDGHQNGRIDNIMSHIGTWLTRHIANVDLVLWLARSGGQLTAEFRAKIRRSLEQPNDIDAWLKKLWELLLAGKVREPNGDLESFALIDKVHQCEMMNWGLKSQLIESMRPYLRISKNFRLFDDIFEEEIEDIPKNQIHTDIILASGASSAIAESLRNHTNSDQLLHHLLHDMHYHLLNALEMLQLLELADNKSDHTYIDRPSISDHSQNRDRDGIAIIISLLRDSWLAKNRIDPDTTSQMVKVWMTTPFPIFKRLAFFAISNQARIPRSEALKWLLSDNGWWLWSIYVQREVLQLVNFLGPQLTQPMLSKLERAILAGPPRDMFRDQLSDEEFQRIVNRNVWLRLSILQSSGANLDNDSRLRLEAISNEYPLWTLSDDEREQFPFWHGSEWGDSDMNHTPITVNEMVDWLIEFPQQHPWKDDDWFERCADDVETTLIALDELSKTSTLEESRRWPVQRWHTALSAWSNKTQYKAMWNTLPQLLIEMPNDVFLQILDSVSGWVLEQSKDINSDHEKIFWSLIDRLLELLPSFSGTDNDDGNDIHHSALNHPAGHMTMSILNWLHEIEFAEQKGIPVEIQGRLAVISDPNNEKMLLGRVILASQVIPLCRIDQTWCIKHLYPLFDWSKSLIEANAAWNGFLVSPQFYRPLFWDIRESFLNTARYAESLNELQCRQYAMLLAYITFNSQGMYNDRELIQATSELQVQGLEAILSDFLRHLRSLSPENGVHFIDNNLIRYFKTYWPHNSTSNSEKISQYLAEICVAVPSRFPQLLEVIQHLLRPVRYTGNTIASLSKSNICTTSPGMAVLFLGKIIQFPTSVINDKQLAACLLQIRTAEPMMASRSTFREMQEYLEGIGYSFKD